MSTEAILTTATMGYRQQVLEGATQYATDYVERVTRNLELNGYDLNVVAPLPTSKMGRNEYVQMKNARCRIEALVNHAVASRRMGDPCIVFINPVKVENYIQEYRAAAIASVEAFVIKLADKVGDIVQATADKSPVWNGSVLTVAKADGTVERWHTKMSVNVSKLGKFYNQWPTRRIK